MPNIVGRTFAAWRVLRLVDATGKRATAICDCGAVREVTIEALITGAKSRLWLPPNAEAAEAKETARRPSDLRAGGQRWVSMKPAIDAPNVISTQPRLGSSMS